MSSRTRSDFGTLGERARTRPQVRHVEVAVGEAWWPGVLVAWQKATDGWWAEVAWVQDDALYARLVPADRVRPLAG